MANKKDSNFNPIGTSRGIRSKTGGVANWGDASPEIVVAAICAASAVGGAIRFGYSRDGGAYAIGVYGDGEPYTEFVKPSEDIDGFMRDCESLFLDLAAQRESATRAKSGPT